MKITKLLVIDDTEIDSFITARIAEQSRFADEVVCCESGSSALSYLRSTWEQKGRLPELIFLDIRMPVMDGFDFMEAFRSLPKEIITATRIVILSSSIDPQDIRRANADPLITAFLNKPVQEEDLLLLARNLAKCA